MTMDLKEFQKLLLKEQLGYLDHLLNRPGMMGNYDQRDGSYHHIARTFQFVNPEFDARDHYYKYILRGRSMNVFKPPHPKAEEYQHKGFENLKEQIEAFLKTLE
jgi:hypothetical protein